MGFINGDCFSVRSSSASNIIIRKGDAFTLQVWDEDALSHDLIGQVGLSRKDIANVMNNPAKKFKFGRVREMRINFEKIE